MIGIFIICIVIFSYLLAFGQIYLLNKKLSSREEEISLLQNKVDIYKASQGRSIKEYNLEHELKDKSTSIMLLQEALDRSFKECLKLKRNMKAIERMYSAYRNLNKWENDN
jgi:uncharacterized membrane protein